MPDRNQYGVSAHLIVGRADEPFLGALLSSLVGAVDTIIVNDNSGTIDNANARTLERSAFARDQRLFVVRAPFSDFADARNRVLDLHRRHGLGEWAAFVDADEVHRPIVGTIARGLAALPSEICFVDGYTRHYFRSLRWYTTIERRMSFFRVTPDVLWTGRIHERLSGAAGSRLALPYVYDHYGAVFPMERQAAKGRQYAALGQLGQTATESDLVSLSERNFFAEHWPLLLRYHGEHSAAAVDVARNLGSTSESERALERTIADFQPLNVRAANVVRRLNFEYRWRARRLDPRARNLMRAQRPLPQ